MIAQDKKPGETTASVSLTASYMGRVPADADAALGRSTLYIQVKLPLESAVGFFLCTQAVCTQTKMAHHAIYLREVLNTLTFVLLTKP